MFSFLLGYIGHIVLESVQSKQAGAMTGARVDLFLVMKSFRSWQVECVSRQPTTGLLGEKVLVLVDDQVPAC